MLKIKAKDTVPPVVDVVPEMEVCQEKLHEEYIGETTPFPSEEKIGKKRTTMKVIVWVCLLNGLAWVWCSYILAWLGREQIAESLSQVALTEIIGVVLVYAIKAAVENLSKNNSWPDKSGANSDPSDGLG